MSFFLNLFGEGLRCWVCDIPINQFKEMLDVKERHQLEWERLFFDFDFIKHYGFDHWSEMATRGEHRFFALKKKNYIELKEKRKTMFKISADELAVNATLFPIYNLKTEANLLFPPVEGMKTILIVEQETGTFAKFELFSSSFIVEDLAFTTIQAIESYLYPAMVSLSYKNEELVSISEDLVVRGTGIMLLHEESNSGYM
jgi:hypothetical protein